MTRQSVRERYRSMRALIQERRARPLRVLRACAHFNAWDSEVNSMRTAIALMNEAGFLTYHETDSRRSDPGLPDVIAARPPRLLSVEFKMTSGKLSPEQKYWREDLLACPGVEYHLVYLDDPASWERFLRAIGMEGCEVAIGDRVL